LLLFLLFCERLGFDTLKESIIKFLRLEGQEGLFNSKSDSQKDSSLVKVKFGFDFLIFPEKLPVISSSFEIRKMSS
jgi:hypothetical protein